MAILFLKLLMLPLPHQSQTIVYLFVFGFTLESICGAHLTGLCQYNIAQLLTFITSEAEFHLISIKPTAVGKGLLHFSNQPLTEFVHFSGPD